MKISSILRRVRRLTVLPLDWFLIKFVLPRDTLLVAGDRRSGNHACIYWLLSCMAGEDILLAHGKRGGPGIRYYPEEKITFINDITNINSTGGVRGLIFRYRDQISQSSAVVLSFEDVSPEAVCTHTLLGNLRTIRVQRNIPDLLASRYESMVRLAMEGGGHQQLFSMDVRWFRNLARWNRLSLEGGADSRVLIWNYDRWRYSAEYRTTFLLSIGLVRDVFPIQQAAEGGGSSFRASSNSTDRLLGVSHRASFQGFLRKALDKFPECFSPEDAARVTVFLCATNPKSSE